MLETDWKYILYQIWNHKIQNEILNKKLKTT